MKEIPLTQGKVAFVDDEDFDSLNQFKWYVKRHKSDLWYAMRWTPVSEGRPRRLILMHCAIAGVKGVDHEDGNGLNNTRINLRQCNQSQNGANRKVNKGRRFKGVWQSSNKKNFVAKITVRGVDIHLGTFTRAEDAAHAYDAKALEAFGEFARPNFPQENPSGLRARSPFLALVRFA